jgi:hypothetical protein
MLAKQRTTGKTISTKTKTSFCNFFKNYSPKIDKSSSRENKPVKKDSASATEKTGAKMRIPRTEK